MGEEHMNVAKATMSHLYCRMEDWKPESQTIKPIFDKKNIYIYFTSSDVFSLKKKLQVTLFKVNPILLARRMGYYASLACAHITCSVNYAITGSYKG